MAMCSTLTQTAAYSNLILSYRQLELCMIKCTTILCGTSVKPLKRAKWMANQYCRYIASECPGCVQTYWIIERNSKRYLKLRKNNYKFDHRDTPR